MMLSLGPQVRREYLLSGRIEIQRIHFELRGAVGSRSLGPIIFRPRCLDLLHPILGQAMELLRVSTSPVCSDGILDCWLLRL